MWAVSDAQVLAKGTFDAPNVLCRRASPIAQTTCPAGPGGCGSRLPLRQPQPFPSAASTHSIRSSPVAIGPARSIKARITSDFGTFMWRAQRVRRAARFLSSFTVIVGMVIPTYYHVSGEFIDDCR